MTNASKDVSRLFEAVREAQDADLHLADDREQARARARLLQAVDREAAMGGRAGARAAHAGTRANGWRWGLGAGLAAAACAAALLWMVPSDERAPIELATLEFRLDGAELTADAMIVTGEQPRVVTVSDSTRLELAPHGRMHIDAIRSNGATVVVEQGEVALAVHHEADTSWRVAAGPWTVHVTGTEFVVAWEPRTEHFRVAVTEGSVRVEGPGGEIARLGAGEELVRTRRAPIAVAEPPDTIDTLPPELDEAIDGAVEQAEPEPDPSPSKPRKPAARGWASLFADADYHAAWDALADLPGGIHGEAERVDDARGLLDLADIARFTKHPSDTRKLLERLRIRFPASQEASEAAFALGRMDADAGAQAKAAVWFERYLDERPDGTFAGDALGRLMDCYDALGQDDAAKSAAKRYLAGHPVGPHAAKAEKLLAR